MRPWLGGMAILNVVGLIIYRYLRDPLAGNKIGERRRLWVLNPSVFWPTLVLLLVISAILQVRVYAVWGGILGYIHGIETALQATTDMAMVYAISESFPLLLMFGYVVIARRRTQLASSGPLTLMMLLYLILTLLFGGLKGSRSNTVWAMFWAVGIVHFFLRPVPKKIIFAGLIFLAAFMYIYGFFKTGGLKALSAIEQGADIREIEQRTGRTTEVLLLGDFSRAESQAFILRQLNNPEVEYTLALGRTYYATLCRIIPRYIWPNRPELKDFEGTSYCTARIRMTSSFSHLSRLRRGRRSNAKFWCSRCTGNLLIMDILSRPHSEMDFHMGQSRYPTTACAVSC